MLDCSEFESLSIIDCSISEFESAYFRSLVIKKDCVRHINENFIICKTFFELKEKFEINH